MGKLLRAKLKGVVSTGKVGRVQKVLPSSTSKGLKKQRNSTKQYTTTSTGKGQKRLLSFNEVRTAIEVSSGRLSKAAKVLGCSYIRLKKFVDENNDKMQSIIDAVKDSTLDNVEDKLMDKINEGNMTAILFYLKCQGKRRGYVEEEKIDLSKLSQPITFIYTPATPK